jgi:hypothetical protein
MASGWAGGNAIIICMHGISRLSDGTDLALFTPITNPG